MQCPMGICCIIHLQSIPIPYNKYLYITVAKYGRLPLKDWFSDNHDVQKGQTNVYTWFFYFSLFLPQSS